MEAIIREKLAPLGRIRGDALSCRVTIEPSDRRHRQGRIHRFTIRLAVPGEEIVVSREPQANPAHEDPYVALRDACDALRRKVVGSHRKPRRA